MLPGDVSAVIDEKATSQKYRRNAGTQLNACRVEFKKQVLPRLCSPVSPASSSYSMWLAAIVQSVRICMKGVVARLRELRRTSAAAFVGHCFVYVLQQAPVEGLQVSRVSLFSVGALGHTQLDSPLRCPFQARPECQLLTLRSLQLVSPNLVSNSVPINWHFSRERELTCKTDEELIIQLLLIEGPRLRTAPLRSRRSATEVTAGCSIARSTFPAGNNESSCS